MLAMTPHPGSADEPATTDVDDGATVFTAVRPRLFGLAYRMLGSAAEADDVVQDTWLRWQRTDRGKVANPEAFLVTVATRIAINVLQSARVRREQYVGPWLPEPVDTSSDPALGAERAEALELGVMMLLETLSPTERASYVLRQAFDYPYERIAGILHLTEANARQLVSRAGRRISAGGRSSVADSTEHRRLLHAFIGAAQRGDLAELEAMFAADVVSTADGGGVVRASRLPIVGRVKLAKFVAAYAPTFWTGVDIHWIDANGQRAAVVRRGETVVAVIAIEAGTAGIERMMWVMNPAKLTRVP